MAGRRAPPSRGPWPGVSCGSTRTLTAGGVATAGSCAASPFRSPTRSCAADGYLYDVIANGFGRMYGYGAQIPVADRWAIAGYLRALQFSQNARPADVPADRRPDLDDAGERP